MPKATASTEKMTLMTPWLRTTNLHSKEELLDEAASMRDIGIPTQNGQKREVPYHSIHPQTTEPKLREGREGLKPVVADGVEERAAVRRNHHEDQDLWVTDKFLKNALKLRN
jgi:hypothetical protein